MEAKAFSPGHITGFFTIKDSPPSVLKKGSLGAGVSLGYGVTTRIKAEIGASTQINIRFNGNEVTDAVVSELVLKTFLNKASIVQHYTFVIDHEIMIPMGSGFGSSGAGALSLAYALNDLFRSGFSPIDCAQIAHEAEVEMKTGLGTVIGETFGGIEIRVKPGAPGIGEIKYISLKKPHKVVALMFGPLSTKEFLSNPKVREKINQYGKILVKDIIKNPGVKNFMECSQKFAYETGLVSPEVSHLIALCKEKGFIMSMPIFGNGLFSIVEDKKVAALCNILIDHGDNAHLIVSDIDFNGARSIYEH
ncbi:MAG: GHMP kinase [Spirochaetales bacterium]|nr:GHMP kinase [Spirochaetales bacterium]